MERIIKNAIDLESGNYIYFKSHARATYMDDGSTVYDCLKELSDKQNNISQSGTTDMSKYVTNEVLLNALSSKQNIIEDLATIRSNAQLGSTAVQSNQLSAVAFSGNYNDLANTPVIPTSEDVEGWGFTKNKEFYEIVNTKVDAIDGKGLSTNDFTTALKNKLEGLTNYDDSEISLAVETLRESLDTLTQGNTSAAIESFNEIIAFLETVEDTESLSGIIAGIEQKISNKQDKIEDLVDIREGAAKGATSVQPDDISEFITIDNVAAVATSGSYEDLQDKPVYITLFDVLSLLNLAQNPDEVGGIESDNRVIVEALAANKIVLVPYGRSDDASCRGYATLVGYVEDLLYFKIITEDYEIIVETQPDGSDIRGQEVTLREWSDKQDQLVSGTNIKTINGESIVGSGNISISTPTEGMIRSWGFTKNEGTITEVKANGTSISTSGVANIPAASTSAYGVTKLSSSTSSTSTTLAATASAVKAAYDLANGKQDKLTSGTNIVTARGNSILTSGDLFAPIIIDTNVVTSTQLIVGHCYIYSVPQTTAKTFTLRAPTTFWNDSINIIIQTSSTITFSAVGITNIYWANGTAPTFESDKVYEISFRCTPMGWLGVAVAFHSA